MRLAFLAAALLLLAGQAAGQSTSSVSTSAGTTLTATDPAYGAVENVTVRTTARTATVQWDVAFPCGPGVVSRLSYWPVGEENQVRVAERTGGGRQEARLEGLDSGTEYAYTIGLAADCGIAGGSSGEQRFVTEANPVWVPALLSAGLLALLGVAAWETRRRL